MTNAFRLTLFALLGLLPFTGCASKGKTARQINSLQAQVGVITDELERLDQSIQETRASIQAAESRAAEMQTSAGSRASGSGIYRTPSGFELPSVSIQQALRNAGYYQGTIDGKIGAKTQEAIRSFQRDNGLEPDGVVGRQTWTKLKSFLGGSVK